jgi:hypothetical protein
MRYFERCRRRVPAFTRRHFRYPGAWRTNRRALGGDLLRAPPNLFWAPFYVTALLAALLARRAGLARAGRLLERVPAGLPTRVQRYVHARIERELLGLNRGRRPDDVAALTGEALLRYGTTRTAGADITNSVASTVFGAVALKQFTPGGIAIGLVLAAWLARRQAADTFLLGDTLGRWYYDVFPPEPSLALQLAGIAAVLACLAVLASLSGLFLDPLQARLGLHQYRLRRMLEHLEQDVAARQGSSFRPRDPYLARLLEVIDAARGPFA